MDRIARVEKRAEYDRCVMYSTHCSCGGHDVTFSIEREDMLGLELYFKVSSKVPAYEDGFFHGVWHKLAATMRLWFGYKIEFEEMIILSGPEHIRDIITALEEGSEHVLKAKSGQVPHAGEGAK